MISDEQIQKDILTRLSVPLWPHTGRSLGLKRGATYTAEKAGKIPTIDGVSRLKAVPTTWLRQKLSLTGNTQST